jgi:hypothetical protein
MKKSRKYEPQYDDEETDNSVKKENKNRRPVRNWKKVWDAHATEYEDVDEFHR